MSESEPSEAPGRDALGSKGMRILACALVLIVAERCASHPTTAPVPRVGEVVVVTLLIDLTVETGFMGRTRYVVAYTSPAHDGVIEVSGRRQERRLINQAQVAELARLLSQSDVWSASTLPATCADCPVWQVQARLNDRASGLAIYQEDETTVPSLVLAIEKAAR